MKLNEDMKMFDPSVALNQLTQSNNGVNRLKATIGAKSFAYSEDEQYVRFKFMKGAKNKGNYVRITLNEMDTYDVEFGRIWGVNYTKVSGAEGLYWDQLLSYFESETGLFLKL